LICIEKKENKQLRIKTRMETAEISSIIVFADKFSTRRDVNMIKENPTKLLDVFKI
jgi:Holliday junction resolvase